MTDLSTDPEHGIKVARGGLIFGVLTSVAGNVANVVMTDSASHVLVRIPGAVVWPVGLFLAIEVMVRNRQHRTKLAYLGRALLMLVSVTTFITSFVNLNGFMTKTDEPWLARVTGPIGVDGLMLGCTVFLLAATLKVADQTTLPAAPSTSVPATPPVQTFATAEDCYTLEDTMKWAEAKPAESALTDADIWAGIGERLGETPVSAPPAPVEAAVERKPRAPRAGNEELERAVLAMARDASVKPSGSSTERRYASVIKILRANPDAPIDAKGVRSELVRAIRDEIKAAI